MKGKVVSVSRSDDHTFSKSLCESIQLIKGLGVEGDAHCGETVKHRSRVMVDPTQPNLRQVHLIHSELLQELEVNGFSIRPGNLGENILTEGLDLLSLPRGTLLHIGDTAVIKVTGLRNPCHQIEAFKEGLLGAVLTKDAHGNSTKKAGIMGIVTSSGSISASNTIEVEFPPPPHKPLQRV